MDSATEVSPWGFALLRAITQDERTQSSLASRAGPRSLHYSQWRDLDDPLFDRELGVLLGLHHRRPSLRRLASALPYCQSCLRPRLPMGSHCHSYSRCAKLRGIHRSARHTRRCRGVSQSSICDDHLDVVQEGERMALKKRTTLTAKSPVVRASHSPGILVQRHGYLQHVQRRRQLRTGPSSLLSGAMEAHVSV